MEKLGVRSDWPKDGRDSDYDYFHGHRSTVMNMHTNSVWGKQDGNFWFHMDGGVANISLLCAS